MTQAASHVYAMTQAILVRVSDDISGPIRLWHVSLIKLSHVLLTHPQTPINRSLPKAFKGRSWRHQDILGGGTKTSWERTPRDLGGPSHLEHKQHQRRFRSTEALLESSPEASRNFKNFDLKCKEHSNQNHLNYLPRSQRSLESKLKSL